MNLQLIYRVDKYLFSHSGVLPKWLDLYNLKLKDLDTLPLDHPSLDEVSSYRGGFDVGSCIWGDVREYYNAYQFADVYQIFGHTQLENAIITDTFACLDCRKCFILENDKITEYKL